MSYKEIIMEISGINSIFPFQLPKSEKDANGGTPLQLADTVDVHQPELLADDEVEGVMSESMDMIVGDPLAALSVHRLSANRVYALLGA